MDNSSVNASQPNSTGGSPIANQGGISPDQKVAGTPDVSQSAANAQNQTDGGKNPLPASAQPQQPQPHPMSRVFDGILKTMTGGPVMYTAPDGSRKEAPQTRGAMGKAIVAA